MAEHGDKSDVAAGGEAPGGADRKKAGRKKADRKKKPRGRGRRALMVLGALAVVLVAVRAVLPTFVQRYVNRTIDQHPMYEGRIGDVDLHLWRGGYVIEDVRLNKTTGNVPVPLFAAERVELVTEWEAVLKGRLVGRIDLVRPELNFVDGETEGEDQTGAGGPWLEIIDELFPFRINTCRIHDGSIHFRAFDTDPPVNLSLSEVEAVIENLGNINDEVTPLIASVSATATALEHARFEYEMKFDPSSYRPTFQIAMRLIGLDVTKTNPLTRAYGEFDFEAGWFDLVVELEAQEGFIEGYVKPLFRNLRIFSPSKDMAEDEVLAVFWEALLGVAAEVLENQPRNQFGTVIEVDGDLTRPQTNLLEIIGNVLRNAFVRAYLPRLQGEAEDIDWLRFSKASITEPGIAGPD